MSKEIEKAARKVFSGNKVDIDSKPKVREKRTGGDSGNAISVDELSLAERGIDRLVGNKKP